MITRGLTRIGIVSVLAVCISLSAVSLAQAVSWPQLGISQSYRNFGLKVDEGPYSASKDITKSKYWAPLDISRLRVIVPWDLAGRPVTDGRRQEFEHWLSRVNALNADPYVVFGPTERTPSSDEMHEPPHWENVVTRRANPGYNPPADPYQNALVAPSGTVYKAAIEDFLATWGPGSPSVTDVEVIGAWNEPNVGNVNMVIPGSVDGPVYLTSTGSYRMTDVGDCPANDVNTCGPMRVAWYWEHAVAAMIKKCGLGGNNCLVVAGEFASSPGTTTSSAPYVYWNTYAKKIEAIGENFIPAQISFHAHRDAEPLGANLVYDNKGNVIGNHDCKSGQTQWCVTTTFRQWINAYGWGGVVGIWNTETGAAHDAGTSSSSDDVAQNNRFNWMLSISDSANVGRLYYFNFQGTGVDRGLIDPGTTVDTRARPIWDTINCRPQTPC